MASLLANELREVIGEFHVAGSAGDAVPGRHANRSRELRARLAES
jgi:hypothetical protein